MDEERTGREGIGKTMGNGSERKESLKIENCQENGPVNTRKDEEILGRERIGRAKEQEDRMEERRQEGMILGECDKDR